MPPGFIGGQNSVSHDKRDRGDCDSDGDRRKEALKQVILNILLNAYEALTDEEGLISMKISNIGGFSVLQISDTGCGIEPENQNSIFLPFFSTKAEGTGLGLATSHRLVEEMGGKITFKSSPEKGSDFFIQFPVFKGGRQL